MTVGDRIKRYRELRGFSNQTEFAACGISKQSLYKYENNIITNIPSDKIEIIARNWMFPRLTSWAGRNPTQIMNYKNI